VGGYHTYTTPYLGLPRAATCFRCDPMGERLFTAVIPPADIVGDLSRWIEWRRDSEWRWMDASEWHVTLAFYADVEAWRYDALVERLVAAAARTQSFRLGLRGVGCFASAAKAHVLYAEVDDPATSLPDLAAHCHTAATTSGIEVARQKYHPHVTLARRNRPADGSRHLRALAELATAAWDVTDIALVQSFLGQGPRGTPQYAVRERLALATR
jgi:RNA 2',3'-cyclic 3'-phosphodiesterase